MRVAIFFAVLATAAGFNSNPIQSDAVRTSSRDRLALLQSICGNAARADGCNACPEGTDFPGEHLQHLDLKAVFYGHFRDRRTEDVIVSFVGCQNHANGLGGAFVLTRRQGKWQRVDFRSGWVLGGDCKQFPASDGRDRLICDSSDMSQGLASEFLEIFDFNAPPEDGSPIFFEVLDSLPNCTRVSSYGVVSGSMQNVTFKTMGRRIEIAVRTRLGSNNMTDAQMSNCEAHMGKPDPLMPRLKTVARTFRFVVDGTPVKPMAGNPPMNHRLAVPPTTGVIE